MLGGNDVRGMFIFSRFVVRCSTYCFVIVSILVTFPFLLSATSSEFTCLVCAYLALACSEAGGAAGSVKRHG